MGSDDTPNAGKSDGIEGSDDQDAVESRAGYLTGQLLIAMPAMRDPRFTRTVIYVCAHNEEGAMGIVVNRLIGSISFQDLMEQLELDPDRIPEARMPSIHFGGPVETGRGFVLHTTDYLVPDSMQLSESLALTATVDILRDISEGAGPDRRLLALGYAGWGPGQLDDELQDNAWLSVDSDPEILFDKVLDDKWDRALAKIGISPSLLSTEAGHA
jgi:putative transcriptional regulator